MKEIWSKISEEIRSQVNQTNWDIFQSSIFPAKVEGNQLVLEAPNEFCKDWVERRYRSMIQKILHEANPGLSCVIVIKPRLGDTAPGKPYQLQLGEVEPQAGFVPKATTVKPSAANKQDATLNGKYSFETFVVGKSNQFAHAVCQAVAKSPGTQYNPVFMYGGVGLGKTHLLQAVGHEVLRLHPKAKIAYLSSESFTNEFIDALMNKKTNDFRSKYRKKDLLLIDDIQFLAGKDAVVEEFFHTFNDLFQNKKQIILTSDVPPKKMKDMQERLISRFEMGVVADIQAPDIETRVAILKSCMESAHLKASEDVLMYLAENVKNNIRELEGAFTRVIAYSSVVQKPVDRHLVDQVLKDLFREGGSGKITIPWIQKKVAEFYDIPETEMTSKRRAANLVLPRQVAMKLSQLMTSSSLSQIGDAFGGRDHTTVMHSCEKIGKMQKSNTSFAEEFDRVSRYVKPSAS
ncbi:MAG TPA: chromosomal replication initiator protein DnaA [Candidatus Ozemobacteraceae bacterium]|nr:chromosomal replication initiator protein DnaA [Candidatus Ozemobacteraceae bacterium]